MIVRDVTSSVLIAVDNLLSKLVTRFDDEELPLRRQEEMCRFIIEEGGDKLAAIKRNDLQSKALDDQVDFTQLLTNAAMHPETSHVTRATQRFAIAHSRDWILAAHADLTAKVRLAIPIKVQITIEDWTGETANGENETDLLANLKDSIAKLETEALTQAKLSGLHWIVLVFGVLMVFATFSAGLLLLLVGAACLTWVFLAYRQIEQTRAKIRAKFATLLDQSTQALRACIAETVELRRDIAKRDHIANAVTALLESISPEQHILAHHDAVRRVLNNK